MTYNVGAPILNISQSDTTVTSKNFRLSGNVKDENYRVAVAINGEDSGYGIYGKSYSWSKDYKLSEGRNTFTVVATNENGKSTTKTVTVVFNVVSPKLQFINCPENTKKDKITVKGRIEGGNEGAMLFIDDEEVYVNYNGEFSETLELEEGGNTFEFRAVNDYGKEVTVKKTITYTPEVEDAVEVDDTVEE